MRDFFDPTPEQQIVVLVDTAMLREAERLMDSCEHCNLEGAEIPFSTNRRTARTLGARFSKRC